MTKCCFAEKTSRLFLISLFWLSRLDIESIEKKDCGKLILSLRILQLLAELDLILGVSESHL